MIVPNSPSLNNESEIKDPILISPLSLSKNKSSRLSNLFSTTKFANFFVGWISSKKTGLTNFKY